jgi:hypothetical protein
MTTYALISPKGSVDRESGTVTPDVPTKEGWSWIPVVEVRPSQFDPTSLVLEGPFDTVEPSRLVRTWTARDKTTVEVAAEKDASIDAQITSLAMKLFFDHENRLRALEGKAALSAVQFRSALKAKA